MQLTVNSAERTKSGKGYTVMASGKRYFSKALGIEQAVGKVVEAKLGMFSGSNGSSVDTIEEFTYVAGASPVSSPVKQEGYWYMAFVSNVCANAIQTGLIKNGEDLKTWVNNAQAAAEAMSDFIPF